MAFVGTWDDATVTWDSITTAWDGSGVPQIHPLKTNRYGGGHKGVKRFPPRELDLLRQLSQAGKGPQVEA